jgi:addiction module RelB/DinJ family antitoxin
MATNSTNINIRMDRTLKEQADGLLAEFGMNMTTAFNIFLRQMVRQGKIPFEISLERPNTEAERKRQARRAFGEVVREIQEQSVINGTDKMTLDEINEIIAEARAAP